MYPYLTATLAAPFEEPTHLPPPSTHPSPTPQPTRAKAKLACASQGKISRCTDETLGIEFEYPATWGYIESLLRPSDSGLSYDYLFGGRTLAEALPLRAGGRSRDFGAGRGPVPTDFRGFGDTLSCDVCVKSSSPICQEVKTDVIWKVEFTNSYDLCHLPTIESVASAAFGPVVRIEVNLPHNATINGFVFQAPFLSEQLSEELDAELLPLLGLGSALQVQGCPTPAWPRAAWSPCTPSIVTKCADEASRQAFDRQVQAFAERVKSGSLDAATLQNLDDLMHLATSISFSQESGG